VTDRIRVGNGWTGDAVQPVTYRADAPGKLVICGEYAVLTPEGTGLVMAVDRPTSATVRPSSGPGIVLDLAWGAGEASVEGDRVRLGRSFSPTAVRAARFVVSALEYSLAAVRASGTPVHPFQLHVSAAQGGSSRTEGRTKAGWGSSAAVVVAVSSAVLAFHTRLGAHTSGVGLGADLGGAEQVFRVALAAHRAAQDGLGSGIDVAASVFGGLVQFQAGTPLPRVVPLTWPAGVGIVVAHTGQVSNTRSRLEVLERRRAEDPAWFLDFVHRSAHATRTVVQALREQHLTRLLGALQQHDRLLHSFGAWLELPMDTPSMAAFRKLENRFGVLKPSGAGGGDCALLFLRSPHLRVDAEKALRDCGLEPLPVRLFAPGVVRGTEEARLQVAPFRKETR